jgi:hypothetical protein
MNDEWDDLLRLIEDKYGRYSAKQFGFLLDDGVIGFAFDEMTKQALIKSLERFKIKE